eukprot:GHVU01043906.1.p1 GENE.GHVU01043906.1~~GHVU01043906.1.p1  ORF type:complete len:192 (+),score=19.22 GHVU01043906.1:533-1108(+)
MFGSSTRIVQPREGDAKEGQAKEGKAKEGKAKKRKAKEGKAEEGAPTRKEATRRFQIMLGHGLNEQYLRALIYIHEDVVKGDRSSALRRYRNICGGGEYLRPQGGAAKACYDLESLWSQYSKQYSADGFDEEVAKKAAQEIMADAAKVEKKYFKHNPNPPSDTTRLHSDRITGFDENGKTDEGWACPSARC